MFAYRINLLLRWNRKSFMIKTKKLILLSILTALAMVLSYVEMLLPPIYPAVPGIKIGLANIVTVFLLYKFSFKEAFLVSILRVVLVSLLFGNAIMMIYSLAGAVLSICFMGILKKLNCFSNVAVSVVGAISHNLGQVAVAVILLETLQIAYYMAVLILSGTFCGILVGIISAYVIKYSKNFKI